LAKNIRCPRINDPDEIKIVKLIEEAFTVTGICHTAMNIKEARVERPLEPSKHPAIALHVYPHWGLDCKFIRGPGEYFGAGSVRTDDS
jgi:hypothetical protein